jgi:hypothetical protein
VRWPAAPQGPGFSEQVVRLEAEVKQVKKENQRLIEDNKV